MTETRLTLHTLAEHVLSAARHAASGRIGLVPAVHGIATPPYGEGHVLEIEGDHLLLHTREGTRSAPITTLRAAVELAGIEAGAPTEVYTPATDADLDRTLTVDAAEMQRLADWYLLGAAALAEFAARHRADGPTPATLWPEHLDLAITSAEVNYGFSPGDSYHEEPYVYVGPFTPPAVGGFWNAPFGAIRAASTLPSVGDAVAFLVEGREAARALP